MPWDLITGHTVRRAEQVGEPGFGYLVRWAHEDPDPKYGVTWVDFAIYVQQGLSYEVGSDGTQTLRGITYELSTDSPRNETLDIDAAQPAFTGFVKWDGCTQWHQIESVSHVDDRADFERFFEAFKLARKVALTELITSPLDDEYAE